MIRKSSLRIKITLVATIIMILISIILTGISVYNANSIFVPTINEENIKNGEVDKDSSIELRPTIGNEIESIGESEDLDIHYRESVDVNSLAYSFKSKAILYMIIIIIIGSIMIYFILGKMLNPVNKLSKQIEVINEYRLSQRISGFNNGDELSNLQDSFNIMLDRLDRAFESQKRFSSDAAHELKTPLAVLKNSLDVLEIDENPSDEDYRYTVSVFRKQTERMINLVNNLFIMSEQKEYHFNDNVDIHIIINDIVNDLENKIKDKNLGVNVKVSNLSMNGNNTMLTHAISNIIQNAVKYNNQNGSIDIIVKECDNNCVITIKDTGIGIEKGKEKEVFEPFYRVDTSRSRKVGGAGLGLTITKDIINRHGGIVTYSPNDGGGSIFEIVLPIIKS
ncbi:HAMP domain-containing protein [Clostridium perfringens]|nr:HAMP domain-containing protein [Clostridium perfringens]